MDYHEEYYSDSKMASDSVLKPDQMFLSRITLSRQSTIGCSSRSYYRNTEGIPFNWEEEPEKPIEPQIDKVLQPLSPPPAVLSLGLAKPSIEVQGDGKTPTKLSAGWLWKQIKRKVKKGKDINKAIVEVFKRGKRRSLGGSGAKWSISDRVEKVVQTEGGGGGDGDGSYLWRFDGEMMRLTPRSSVSSSLSSSNSLSSSSSLMSNAPSLKASKCEQIW